MLTFKQFCEANYGILQHDKRIPILRDYIRPMIVDEWKKTNKIPVSIKNIQYAGIFFDINIVIGDENSKSESMFIDGMCKTIDQQDKKHFEITINTHPRCSIEHMIEYNDFINPILSHEIKHAFDINGGMFNGDKKKYINPDENYKKYVTQIYEIDNYLVSIIEELRIIKDRVKDISFDKALQNCKIWTEIYDVALFDFKKLNKFKSKLAAYWNSDKLDAKENLKSLRTQAILLNYVYRKKGSVALAKLDGKNVAEMLKQNVEQMTAPELRHEIDIVRSLLIEAGVIKK